MWNCMQPAICRTELHVLQLVGRPINSLKEEKKFTYKTAEMVFINLVYQYCTTLLA